MMKGEKLSCHQENFKNPQVAPYQILQYIHRHLKLHISLKIKKKYPQLNNTKGTYCRNLEFIL